VDDETYWTTVTGLRLRFADYLEGLEPAAWQAPSLCADWRVRDVAGHLSMVPTVTLGEMLAVGPRAGFNPNRINTILARRYGSREPAQIIGRIREHAAARRTAKGLHTEDWLFDLAVHSQDVAVPLGRPFEVPVDAAVAGLERVWEMGWPFRARRRLHGLTLSAADGSWTVGSGPEVRGPALALLLLLTGRNEAAAPSLEGPGLARAVA
jgi:uncharacterized protein (TIGR03083 family)